MLPSTHISNLKLKGAMFICPVYKAADNVISP